MKKVIIIIVVVGAILGGASWGVFLWRDYVREQRVLVHFEGIKDLVAEGKKHQALYSLVHRRPLKIPDSIEQEWYDLELDLAVSLKDMSRSEVLISKSPELLQEHEEAALLWARHLLHFRKSEEYAKLRKSWKEREQSVAKWFFLDVDALLLDGDRLAMKDLLQSQTFLGREEQQRKIYLALFQSESIEEAWQQLSEAYEIDPKNAEVRTFSANILESMGNMPAAQREYTAAWLNDIENPLFRDNLAEFYRRNGNLTQAIQTWGARPDEPLYDFIWLKYYFWSKVYTGLPETTPEMRKSHLSDLAGVLGKLGPASYWSEKLAEQEQRVADNVVAERLMFWFSIIQDLQTGNHEDALKILLKDEANASSQSPELSQALIRILKYQLHGVSYYPRIPLSNLEQKHRFFQQVFDAKLPRKATDLEAAAEIIGAPKDPEPFVEFVDSSDAITAAFLAAGWMNVALSLHDDDSDTAAPDWFHYGLTQAYRYCQGNKQAIAFASELGSKPPMVCLLGELYIADGQIEEGIKHLQSIVSESSDAAYRAAWLLSSAYLERGDLTMAEKILQKQPAFGESIDGQSIAARIAIARNDLTKAGTIYRSILDESIEAKIFFARKAFANREWKIARQYINEAIKLQPNEPMLYENLEKIKQAEAASP